MTTHWWPVRTKRNASFAFKYDHLWFWRSINFLRYHVLRDRDAHMIYMLMLMGLFCSIQKFVIKNE